jgi:hypothetical protein
MREPEMFEPMISLLASKGYRIVSQRRGRKPGADIIAERNSRRLLMEMKGDSEVISVDLGTGIFQLFRYIKNDPDEDYALGVSEKYVRYVKQVEIPLRKLGIQVFVVGSSSYQLW